MAVPRGQSIRRDKRPTTADRAEELKEQQRQLKEDAAERRAQAAREEDRRAEGA